MKLFSWATENGSCDSFFRSTSFLIDRVASGEPSQPRCSGVSADHPGVAAEQTPFFLPGPLVRL